MRKKEIENWKNNYYTLTDNLGYSVFAECMVPNVLFALFPSGYNVILVPIRTSPMNDLPNGIFNDHIPFGGLQFLLEIYIRWEINLENHANGFNYFLNVFNVHLSFFSPYGILGWGNFDSIVTLKYIIILIKTLLLFLVLIYILRQIKITFLVSFK